MRRFKSARLGILALTALTATAAWQIPVAARPRLDPQAVPPPPRLETPHREAPQPIDPEADVQTCAACRLAAQTSGTLPSGSYLMSPEVLEDGVALRVTSSDQQVRDTLWKSTLARGALLDAMRTGSPVHLCAQCRERISMLADLKIEARRIPEGMVLVYTSASPEVVRHIHAIVRATQVAPVQF